MGNARRGDHDARSSAGQRRDGAMDESDGLRFATRSPRVPGTKRKCGCCPSVQVNASRARLRPCIARCGASGCRADPHSRPSAPRAPTVHGSRETIEGTVGACPAGIANTRRDSGSAWLGAMRRSSRPRIVGPGVRRSACEAPVRGPANARAGASAGQHGEARMPNRCCLASGERQVPRGFARCVATEVHGSSGQGCLGYLPFISFFTSG